MGTVTFKKNGKLSTRPDSGAMGRHDKTQELGSCYFYRQTILPGNRDAQLSDNDYGKKQRRQEGASGGKRVNPRRTMITGASQKTPGDPKLPY